MINIFKKLNSYFKSGDLNDSYIDYSDMLDDYILNKRLLSNSIQERSANISNMSGIEFENYIKDLFTAKGVRCETTPTSGDYGVDLIAYLNSKKIAIQCKRYKDRVGFSAVQEVYTGKDLYECSEAWVVTNSSYSRQALEASSKLKIKLINVCNVLDQIKLAY
jgi:restriction system protein